MTKEEFYQELLGLPRPWRVERVVLDKASGRVDVWLMHPEGLRWNCPFCRQALAVYDHVPERVWRHLDTCEYRTFLHARLPRVACPKHGGWCRWGLRGPRGTARPRWPWGGGALTCCRSAT